MLYTISSGSHPSTLMSPALPSTLTHPWGDVTVDLLALLRSDLSCLVRNTLLLHILLNYPHLLVWRKQTESPSDTNTCHTHSYQRFTNISQFTSPIQYIGVGRGGGGGRRGGGGKCWSYQRYYFLIVKMDFFDNVHSSHFCNNF